jgi:hypothetical protein
MKWILTIQRSEIFFIFSCINLSWQLVSILLSKTIPARSKVANSKTQTRVAAKPTAKRKQTSESASAPATKKPNRRATVEEVENEEAPPIMVSVLFLFIRWHF